MSHFVETLPCGCDVYGSAFGYFVVTTSKSGPACSDEPNAKDMPKAHPFPKPAHAIQASEFNLNATLGDPGEGMGFGKIIIGRTTDGMSKPMSEK